MCSEKYSLIIEEYFLRAQYDREEYNPYLTIKLVKYSIYFLSAKPSTTLSNFANSSGLYKRVRNTIFPF